MMTLEELVEGWDIADYWIKDMTALREKCAAVCDNSDDTSDVQPAEESDSEN